MDIKVEKINEEESVINFYYLGETKTEKVSGILGEMIEELIDLNKLQSSQIKLLKSLGNGDDINLGI